MKGLKEFGKVAKRNNGITLTVLVITVVVLLLIASVVIINATAGIEQKALNNMYNDIRILDGKIALYYEIYGKMPLKYIDGVVESIEAEQVVSLKDMEINPNDNDKYLVIDKSKLDNLNLAYPDGTYVINARSHTIYYIEGISVDGKEYYKLPIEYDEVKANVKYAVTYCPGEYGTFDEKTYDNIMYGDPTPEFEGETISKDESFVFAGWVEEYSGKIGTYEIVEKNSRYIAQWSSLEQELSFELFGGINAQENASITSYIIGQEQIIYTPTREQENIEYERVGIPECDIYIFDGWYLDEKFENELTYIITDSGEKQYYISERGIYPSNTLYARWMAPAVKKVPVSYEFSYTGEYQQFIAPVDGTYQIQLWGADGGTSLANNVLGAEGGKGSYVKGEIDIKKGEILYIYVGKKGENAVKGQNSKASYNGGGLGTWDGNDDEAAGAGGGATDIRLISGEWNEFESLKSRIMVAGAGGGASWKTAGGYAGFEGSSNNSTASAGTQTTGYKFGIGQDGYGVGDSDCFAGTCFHTNFEIFKCHNFKSS